MAKAVIVKVVECDGTRFGDMVIAYYASGRTHEWYGECPRSVWEWCEAHTLVADKYPHPNRRYRRWE